MTNTSTTTLSAFDPTILERAARVAEALRNIGPMLDLRLSGATIIYELLTMNTALLAHIAALEAGQ
jgi:hypothetical protein